MIVVLKHGVTDDKRDQLISWLKNLGLQIHISVGAYQTVLGLIGDTSRVDMDLVGSLEIVDAVKRVTEPFKCCNRKFHPEDMVVDCQVPREIWEQLNKGDRGTLCHQGGTFLSFTREGEVFSLNSAARSSGHIT